MQTKLNPAQLYKAAMNRSKAYTVTQEPKTFFKGGSLMGPMQQQEGEENNINMPIEDKVRAIYSAQRQMLRGTM